MVILLITSFLSSNVVSIYKSKDLFPYHHFQSCMLLHCVERPYFYLANLPLSDAFDCEQCYDEYPCYMYLSASAQSFLHSKFLDLE